MLSRLDTSHESSMLDVVLIRTRTFSTSAKKRADKKQTTRRSYINQVDTKRMIERDSYSGESLRFDDCVREGVGAFVRRKVSNLPLDADTEV